MPGCSHSWLLLLVSVWLLLIVAPTFLGDQHPVPAGAIYFFFAHVCHQLPDRSFQLAGTQLAVCHRCLGIYLGFWLGVLCWPWLRRPGLLLLARPRLILLPAALLIISALNSSTPFERVATGLLVGFPFALFAWIAFDQLLGTQSSGVRLAASRESLARSPAGDR